MCLRTLAASPPTTPPTATPTSLASRHNSATRCGDAARVADGVAELCRDANEAGVAVGGVVGGDAANVLRHMELGMRLIAPPVFASDFALHGAADAAAPFHEAAAAFNSS